jgi:hypothetical protein
MTSLFLVDLFCFLFSSKKTNIYTTFNQEEYFKTCYSLKEAGINYRSKTTNMHPRTMGHVDYISTQRNSVQYDIYVRKEDEHSALRTIFSKNEYPFYSEGSFVITRNTSTLRRIPRMSPQESRLLSALYFFF